MRFVVQIRTDNAAFSNERGDDEDAGYFRDAEVARILDGVVTRLKDDAETSGELRDYNGNVVGHFQYVEDD